MWFYNPRGCGVAGKIVRSPFGVMHGKSSPVYYNEKGEDLFSGLSKYEFFFPFVLLFFSCVSFPKRRQVLTFLFTYSIRVAVFPNINSH